MRRGRFVCAVSCAFASLMPAAPAAAQELSCQGDFTGGLPTPRKSDRKLVLGMYPGGPAGVIAGPRPPAVPESQPRIDAALDRLRGGRPYVVHLYKEFENSSTQEGDLHSAEAQATHYGGRGLLLEFVLPYRASPAPNVNGYVAYVREFVRRLGGKPGVKAIQVTNEVNNTVSPDASDGNYEGARDALVRGVIAAKAEARARGFEGLEIGFNWFYRLDPNTESGFWSELGSKGGRQFAGSVDWVGLDAYPGTFFPPTVLPRRDSMANAMSVLRECYMPLAGLGKTVPIHVTENGWPTSPPLRSYAEQERALREMVTAVYDFRANYNVTDYRWFDLRDANSSSPDFQQQYGLTRDDYSPKPAFGAYQELIRRFGVENPLSPGRGGAGPDDPGPPSGTRVPCPHGNSSSVRCARARIGGRSVLHVVGTPAHERLVGSRGRDVIVCGAGDDVVRAGRGNDLVRCASGRDRMAAGSGSDRVYAGRGRDRLRGSSGRDRLVGNEGGDRLIGGPGRDAFRAGDGPDRVLARDRVRERVSCGRGRDRARADRRDRVGRSCERLRR